MLGVDRLKISLESSKITEKQLITSDKQIEIYGYRSTQRTAQNDNNSLSDETKCYGSSFWMVIRKILRKK